MIASCVESADSGGAETHSTAEASADASERRRHPMEAAQGQRPVEAMGHILAAVPSLRSAAKVWAKLGFNASPRFDFCGCSAFDLAMEGGGLRFLTAAGGSRATTLSTMVEERLVGGAGLLGWIWHCADPARAARVIETLAATRLAEPGAPPIALPSAVTPGACTVLESGAVPGKPEASHPNRIRAVDHLVLLVDDVERVAASYERNFALHAKTATIGAQRYAYLKVGGPVLEIVGPDLGANSDAGEAAGARALPGGGTRQAQGGRPGAGGAALWGLALRSDDLDATVAYLRAGGVRVRDPHAAIQGGRIAGLPMPLGGMHIAFLGD